MKVYHDWSAHACTIAPTADPSAQRPNRARLVLLYVMPRGRRSWPVVMTLSTLAHPPALETERNIV
jgi:hypothetical protein